MWILFPFDSDASLSSSIELTLIRSDLSGNGDPSLELEGIEVRDIGSLLD